MNAKIIASLVAIAGVAALAGGATVAYFSDKETSTGNTFTAGNLDMQLAAGTTGEFVSEPVTLATVKDMAPGQVAGPYVLRYTNIGSVSGKIKVSVDYTEDDNDTEDGKALNEYARVNYHATTNPDAVDLGGDDYAKLLIVTDAKMDSETNIQYWWARQIIAEKYANSDAAVSGKAVVLVSASGSPDPSFEGGKNYAPTVFGLKQVEAFKLTDTLHGDAIEVKKGEVHTTELTLKLDENADNKSQFDGNAMTLTATMSQFTDPAW